ncbi:MAG: hypothetical protein HOP19_27540 [Acidobacteria bacterium]|nr:hypothetical protein [Acidobacteriota bacterium]
MIPALTQRGWLPPGVHWATWEEFVARYGGTPLRDGMLAGLRAAMDELAQAGCQAIYINGSFVTAKLEPNDYDACWSIRGVTFSDVDPVLHDFSERRKRMKEKYRGELFYAESAADFEGRSFLDYFQRDKRSGQRKGIIAIRLEYEAESVATLEKRDDKK